MSMSEDEQGNAALEAAKQRVNGMGIATLLGMQIEAIQDGVGRVRIVVDERLMHPQQIVHGGVLFTLADTAMSMAVVSAIGPGLRFSTIEAKINFLAPVRAGELVAEATVVQRGRSIAVLEATVFNENGEGRQAVARALGTFSIGSARVVTPTE
jgi:acyl-CoA thioesterase